jgi:hypothetical protein
MAEVTGRVPDFDGPRTPPGLIDVLDRVLDRGIVIDAWVHVAALGIDLLTIDARCVVASIPTYLSAAEPMRRTPPVAHPADASELRGNNAVHRTVEDYLRHLDEG